MTKATEPYTFALRIAWRIGLAALVLLPLDYALSLAPAELLARLQGMPGQIEELGDTNDRILYLGDSIVHRQTKDDPKQTSLAAKVQILLDRPVVTIAHPAQGPDAFLAKLEWLDRRGVRPRAVILPVNMRAFGPEWELNPSWNFSRDNRMYLHPLSTHLLAVFKYDFGRPDPGTLIGRRIVIGGEDLGSGAYAVSTVDPEFPGAVEMRRRYLVRYGNDLRKSSRFATWKDLLTILRSSRVPALVYITPVNFEDMRRFLGPQDMARVEANIDHVSQLLREFGLSALDLSDTLRSEDFDQPPGIPGGHLLRAGVSRTALRIATALKPILAANPPDGRQP